MTDIKQFGTRLVKKMTEEEFAISLAHMVADAINSKVTPVVDQMNRHLVQKLKSDAEVTRQLEALERRVEDIEALHSRVEYLERLEALLAERAGISARQAHQ